MGPDADDVEQCILNVATEDVAGHELGGRHILEGGFREDFTGHLCLRQFEEEAVLQHRVHLEGVAEAHLFFGKTGQQR